MGDLLDFYVQSDTLWLMYLKRFEIIFSRLACIETLKMTKVNWELLTNIDISLIGPKNLWKSITKIL